MRIIPAFFLLIFIITACSNDNEEAITKADYISEDPVNAAENAKDMDALEYIEFQHNEEQNNMEGSFINERNNSITA